jgi:hypothetical protein
VSEAHNLLCERAEVTMRALRIATTTAWIGLALGGTTGSPAGVRAQRETSIRARQLFVDREGVPHVEIDASEIESAALRDRLESGLPQRLVMHVAAYRMGAPVATVTRSCSITYLPYERRFRAGHTMGTLPEAMQECLRIEDLAIGSRSDWSSRPRSALSYVALIELNPPSADGERRLRDWLIQHPAWPAGSPIAPPPRPRPRSAEMTFGYSWKAAER